MTKILQVALLIQESMYVRMYVCTVCITCLSMGENITNLILIYSSPMYCTNCFNAYSLSLSYTVLISEYFIL